MSITITNKLIIEEAAKIGISHRLISERHNLIILSDGDKEILIRRAITPLSSALIRYVADHKDATYDVLEDAGFRVPETIVIPPGGDLLELGDIKFPLVVKPEDSAYGLGVTIGVKNNEDLKEAYNFAYGINNGDVLIQTYIPGDDFRILCVNHKVVAVSKRIPCRVFGDGNLNINELVEKENKNPNRGMGHTKPMTIISIDKHVEENLKKQNFNLQSVPKKGKEVFLRETANLSTGGESEDCTDNIPDENIKMFEQMSKSLFSGVVGIDVRCKDITKILEPDDYAVIEVNASPGIRMHHFPSFGKSRNVAKEILKGLFPEKF